MHGSLYVLLPGGISQKVCLAQLAAYDLLLNCWKSGNGSQGCKGGSAWLGAAGLPALIDILAFLLALELVCLPALLPVFEGPLQILGLLTDGRIPVHVCSMKQNAIYLSVFR
eukprot:CAMPEP_0202373182 /NCGR_PEP_ID=MMETSP1127-20130417/4248_1 /ASSEMBLY_ACC=CAM_ASM_000462 /TAXON_ID=3047 /ORGANISM="Dunaliella tertiolecta, Strain CCMP1320" /LENGTH=111 /DNA_ID=CAMNT_0048969975 /DNA_START=344 /DNA_END=675 /DNA_ORIENTATION=-